MAPDVDISGRVALRRRLLRLAAMIAQCDAVKQIDSHQTPLPIDRTVGNARTIWKKFGSVLAAQEDRLIDSSQSR